MCLIGFTLKCIKTKVHYVGINQLNAFSLPHLKHWFLFFFLTCLPFLLFVALLVLSFTFTLLFIKVCNAVSYPHLLHLNPTASQTLSTKTLILTNYTYFPNMKLWKNMDIDKNPDYQFHDPLHDLNDALPSFHSPEFWLDAGPSNYHTHYSTTL